MPTTSKSVLHINGDPRFASSLSPFKEDVESLLHNRWLSTNLVDYLIQQGCPNPFLSDDDNDSKKSFVYVGNLFALSTNGYINQQIEVHSNLNIRTIHRQAKRAYDSFKDGVERIAAHYSTFAFIFPLHHEDPGHYNVLYVVGHINSSLFYDTVQCYDSMKLSGTIPNDNNSEFHNKLKRFNKFIVTFLLPSIYSSVNENDYYEELLKKFQFCSCPQQKNGSDCGLFAMALILHIVDGIHVDANTFSQESISQLRQLLGSHLVEIRNLHRYIIPSSVIRNVFKNLKPLENLIVNYQSSLTNEIGYGSATARQTSSATTSTSTSLTHNPCMTINLSLTPPDGEVSGITFPEQSHEENIVQGMEEFVDMRFEEVLQQKGINKQDHFGYQYLDEWNECINLYEQETGNSLAIVKSKKSVYREYRCMTHIDCSFMVRFGKQRNQNRYIMKKFNYQHKGRLRAPLAIDGRSRKKRNSGFLEPIIEDAGETKLKRLTNGDVKKAAATRANRQLATSSADAALRKVYLSRKEDEVKSYQLIIPYLEKMKDLNPDSVSGFSIDDNNCLTGVHFIPGIMNHNLQFVRPVISLDACHLLSSYQGTLFVASTLSAANEIYVVGFQITACNEDETSWIKFLNTLKDACPRLQEQYTDGGEWKKWVFVSDRQKGLIKALEEVFPGNLHTYCVHHIQANVRTLHKSECAKYIFAMARTFSTHDYAYFLNCVRTIKPAAAKYISEIEGFWKNVTWMQNESSNLPPRYGILTSNTSESVNSLFKEERQLPWLQLMEAMVDKMTTRISEFHRKYEKQNPDEIIPALLPKLKNDFKKCNSITIIPIDINNGDYDGDGNLPETRRIYKATEFGRCDNSDSNAETQHDLQSAITNFTQLAPKCHIVTPDKRRCTCGKWQSFEYPCRHGFAYYRQIKNDSLDKCLNHVSKLYTFGSLQSLYQRNFVPAVSYNIIHDETTSPPPRGKQKAGRPKKVRKRNVGELLHDVRSGNLCSNCKTMGHNKRRCPYPIQQSEQTEEMQK